MLGGKETYKYLRILEADTIKPVEMKENILKRVPQANEETTQNQTIYQKSHQRDKRLCCLPCKIAGTVLEVCNIMAEGFRFIYLAFGFS